VLRHFVLKEVETGSDQRRAVGIISDDERPFIVYEAGRHAPAPTGAPAEDKP